MYLKSINQAIDLYLEECKWHQMANTERREKLFCEECNSNDIDILLKDPIISKCLKCGYVWIVSEARIVGV